MKQGVETARLMLRTNHVRCRSPFALARRRGPNGLDSILELHDLESLVTFFLAQQVSSAAKYLFLDVTVRSIQSGKTYHKLEASSHRQIDHGFGHWRRADPDQSTS